MSIRKRLDDAQLLWAGERKEGAFVLILCAADATAKKRYPSIKQVGDRFKRYILDEMGTITGGPRYNVEVPFAGKKTPLEDVFYYHLRCSLVHEAVPSPGISFTEPVKENGKTYNVLSLSQPLGFPINWAWNLLKAVWDSPENSDTCGTATPDNPTEAATLIAAVETLSKLNLSHTVEASIERPAS